jgi:phosphoribosylglycinamide formyltransferase-1
VAARVFVLASGAGTLVQALIDALAEGTLKVDIVAVGSDVPAAPVLSRAAAAGIPAFVCAPADYASRVDWDAALLDRVKEYSPDLVVSAGFMRILGPGFVDTFVGKVINTHPALLPSFPGTHAVRDALAYGVKITGCTVHLVDHGVDTGPILAQRAVDVLPDDDVPALHERIKVVERELLVATIAQMTKSRPEVASE